MENKRWDAHAADTALETLCRHMCGNDLANMGVTTDQVRFDAVELAWPSYKHRASTAILALWRADDAMLDAAVAFAEQEGVAISRRQIELMYLNMMDTAVNGRPTLSGSHPARIWSANPRQAFENEPVG